MRYLIVALLGWLCAQLGKILVDLILHKKIDWKFVLVSSGGMPSSHTATMIALTTYIILVDGLDTATSALSIVLSFIVMYDAVNVRQETGKQGQYLNTLSSLLHLEDSIQLEKHFKELVGHTPLQVFVGFLVGLLVGFSCFSFF